MGSNGVVVLPEQEFVWEMEPDRTATFKLLSEQTGNSIPVFEELIPAGFGTALHLHHGSDEAMCVLSGEFAFKIGDAVTRGGPGAWAFMPREIAHAWKNDGKETGRALFMFTPADAGKLFEELRRLQLPFMNDCRPCDSCATASPVRMGDPGTSSTLITLWNAAAAWAFYVPRMCKTYEQKTD